VTQRLIRDPIHDLIYLTDSPRDRLLFSLVRTREFQRLRRIKQLGFADMVFPGATHSRFAHSLGVLWNCRRFLDRIEIVTEQGLDDDLRTIVEVAALLHDVGHGPFSHAFEKVTNIRHEKRTVEIILSESTEIHEVLAGDRCVENLPCRVAALFPEGEELVRERCTEVPECPLHLRHVVSSQFDADRSDYLLRDSHFAGVKYGSFDFAWLIGHLLVDPARPRLVLGRKSRHGLEDYVFARYYMYQAVYFHKTTRAAEVMLRLLFGKMKSMIQGDTGIGQVVSGVAPELLRAFESRASLADFLALDDNSVFEFLKRGAISDDSTIQYLSSGLLNRRLYKCVDATDGAKDHPERLVEFGSRMKELLIGETGLPVDSACAFEQDTPSDTPYKIYDPDPESENVDTQLYVELDTGEIRELSQASGIVEALKRKITLLRYYFPEELRGQVNPLASRLLGRQ
jgi:HD superfamily phosphohydrolase